MAILILAASLTASPAASAVREIAHIPLPTATTNEGIQAIALSGTHAFAADTSEHLFVFDVSDPAKPGLISSTPTGSPAHGIAVAGSTAFLAIDAGLLAFDISNPVKPRQLASWDAPTREGVGISVTCAGNLVLLANQGDGLRVFDAENPSKLINVGHLTMGSSAGGQAMGIAVSSNIACVANLEDGLRVVDISNPAKPAAIGHSKGDGGPAFAVTLHNSRAYLANGSDGVRVFDVSTPSAPRSICHIPLASAIPAGVAVSANTLYVAAYDAGIQLYDISAPARPVEKYRSPHNFAGQALAALVDRDHLYVASGSAGLRIYTIPTSDSP